MLQCVKVWDFFEVYLILIMAAIQYFAKTAILAVIFFQNIADNHAKHLLFTSKGK